MGTKQFAKIDKAFLPRPPLEALQPEKGVPRPNVFDEVQLGSYVSKTDANIAYQVWSLPDRALGKAWRRHKNRPYTQQTGEPEAHILVHNVYEHLMSNPLLPVSREDAESKFQAEGLEKDWEVSYIIDELRDDIIKGSTLNNLESWGSYAIKELLMERGQSTDGDRRDLENRAEKTELERHFGIMPRRNLKDWGLKMIIEPRTNPGLAGWNAEYALQPFENDWMSTLDMYTFAVHLSPYNPAYWTSRAYCHYQLAYFDLALGDAYRAKVLCNVLINGDERSRRPGLYPRIWHAIEQHLLVQPRKEGDLKPEIHRLRVRGAAYFASGLVKALELITTLSLLALNCWHDLDKRYNSFSSNLIMTQDRDSLVPQQLRQIIESIGQSRRKEKKADETLFWHERFQGCLPAEPTYPYGVHVDRNARGFVDTANVNIFCQDGMKPKCKLLPKKNNTLGVFAARHIKRGEVIHFEEPIIRSHLRPRRMTRDKTAVMDEIRCENCKRKIEIGSTRFQLFAETRFERCACSPAGKPVPGPDDRVFCNHKGKAKGKSLSPSCRNIASRLHHFSSCGKDWSWLHDAMRPVIRQWQDKEYIVQCNDVYGTMHSLLLRNIFEITLHRRKENPHLSPLEIDEILILDPTDTNKDWLPFSYVGNITVPFDILTYMGVDIFRDLSFDTWVIQSIMHKLVSHAIPWDEKRRGDGPGPELLPGDAHKTPMHPDIQDMKVQKKESFKNHDPSFMDLYLFPGFSLFKRSVQENANWGYDHEVPNRLVVWAASDIKKGEEIIVRDPYCGDDPSDLTKKGEKQKPSVIEQSKELKKEHNLPNKKNKPERKAPEITQRRRTRKASTAKATAASEPNEETSTEKGKVVVNTIKTDATAKNPKQKSPIKRKRDEYAEVDDIRVSIYRHPEDADPPPGKQRRKAHLHAFRPRFDTRHDKWYENLEEMHKTSSETAAEKMARIKMLKKGGLVAYRQAQREAIDELDRRAGRPRRKRDPALE
ncbi:uncharacterized protein N7484_001926 [Penicillium longicatenatum]|uniref:uncharacterized protein n=1 Tax=Penicillium longicatenatum TaxID=1561947 RepID=UPI0025467572|nr:uncharacterized protein N7484_001926 [Penicillium longicatenatum]KAJ5658277.1 hypothetical protein N7484_001926 [Penicillium longicatenatum]